MSQFLGTMYVIKTTYIGCDSWQHLNEDTVDVRPHPLRRESDGRPVFMGSFCDANNEWHYEAYGGYEELDAACEKAQEITGGIHRLQMPGSDPISGEIQSDRERQSAIHFMQENGIAARFFLGLYPRWGPEESCKFAAPLEKSITAETTEAEIETLVEQALTDARITHHAELDSETIYHRLMEKRGDAIEKVRTPANVPHYVD